jgi:GNAT superfamily N-acetyltransferase
MLPMTATKAVAYWRRVAAGLERGELRLLVAESPDGRILGTVQLLLDQPENQPHRGDIAKMLVHRQARGRGVGAELLTAIEGLALRLGKSLLVLDTASGPAERLYRRQGWQYSGDIPGYALWPGGGPCTTRIFYKSLAA